MSELHYRRATIHDVDLLCDLRIEFATSIRGAIDDRTEQRIRESVREYYTRMVPSDDFICTLCYDGDELAALGAMLVREQPGGVHNPSGRVGYIVNMYTREAFRRRGICRTIMQMLIDFGKQQGLTVFDLHASDDGARVYAQMGFALHPQPEYRLVLE